MFGYLKENQQTLTTIIKTDTEFNVVYKVPLRVHVPYKISSHFPKRKRGRNIKEPLFAGYLNLSYA